MTRDQANEYVRRYHRHSGPRIGAKFCLGAVDPDGGGLILGVAIVGRPVARNYDDGWTLEVSRLCSQSHPNVGSFLYGAAWRAARALGYRRLVTYTLAGESGTSLRAAGWRIVGERGARRGWSVPSRPRVTDYTSDQRILWEVGV